MTGITSRPQRRPLSLATLSLALAALAGGCTQETQNEVRRGIQNWTGTDGVLEIYGNDKLLRRFLKIDKLSTAYGTDDGQPRSYRYGYGVLDENLNFSADNGEKRVYFEVPGAGATWVFFDNPH